MPVHEYDPPERFVAGTVGQPGQRTFFLQARAGARLTSVALEKTQVSALAERVGELLDEIVRRSGGAAPVPALPPAGTEDTAPLDLPIDEEFRVGTMSLAWDGERDVVVIECFEVSETEVDPEQPEPAPDQNLLRVSLDGAAARAFAARSLALVAAGRPPCPFCAGPLDPAGHVCPRANGYRR
ncbi:DUF3090 domain-containing protein [Kineococcus sp. DHX-1]|uniref:DUF3090 domain-containing protein n=1 Tax=Kineococcus sp. DHX-1 TaxID=3349638 RepID=UPI0036D2CCAF